MVKLVNPLQSEAASGKVGEGAIYGRRRGQNIARRYARPRQPNTTGQKTSTDRLKLTGILSNRIRVGRLARIGERMTVTQFYASLASTEQTWQQRFTSEMLNSDPEIYLQAQFEWSNYNPARRALWERAATRRPLLFPSSFLMGTEFTAGEFLIALTIQMQRDGFGFYDPSIPPSFVSR